MNILKIASKIAYENVSTSPVRRPGKPPPILPKSTPVTPVRNPTKPVVLPKKEELPSEEEKLAKGLVKVGDYYIVKNGFNDEECIAKIKGISNGNIKYQVNPDSSSLKFVPVSIFIDRVFVREATAEEARRYDKEMAQMDEWMKSIDTGREGT